MVVNTKKTKIMVCRRGGKPGRNEGWSFKGERLETVREYKYLGYWFTAKGGSNYHVKMMKVKEGKAVNMAWGIMKRARISSLKKRLYLMDALAKSEGLYGAEIWGWVRRNEIETLQGKAIKMAMGVNENTPDYIWKMEAGKFSLEIETRKRASRYLMRILTMGEERLPKICLKEEIRAIRNGNPSNWGKELKKAFETVGDGETVEGIAKEESIEGIAERLERGLKTRMEQEIQSNWNKIRDSKYWPHYRNWKKEIGAENYWEEDAPAHAKEEWARIRCGSVGTEGRNGMKVKECRLCGRETESISHILQCPQAEKIIRKEWVEGVQRWKGESKGKDLCGKIERLLSGKINTEICEYFRQFEWWVKRLESVRKNGSQSSLESGMEELRGSIESESSGRDLNNNGSQRNEVNTKRR